MTNKTPRESLSAREQAEELLADGKKVSTLEDLVTYCPQLQECIRALCDELSEREKSLGIAMDLLQTEVRHRFVVIKERDQLKAKLEAVRVLLRDDKPDAAYEILWNDYKESGKSFNGDMSEFLIKPEYIDLSVKSNREGLALEAKLRELVKEWRDEADMVRDEWYNPSSTLDACADQIEQLLEKNNEQDK